MYEIVLAHAAKKSLKRLKKSGRFNKEMLDELIKQLAFGKALSASYKDHQLRGDLSIYRECHLGFDILVQYKKNELSKVITISEIGSHDKLFGK